MPIDPRIPLSALGGSPQQLDVAGTIYRSQAAHAMQAEAQRKQQEALKQQQIDALAQQYPDPEDYIQAVSRIDPMAAREFGEQFEKHKKSQLSTYSEKLKVRDELMNFRLRTLQAVETPAQYGLWRNSLVQENPEMDQVVPPPDQWTPEVNTRLLSIGDTIANTIKNQQEVTDKFLKGEYRLGLLKGIAGAPTVDIALGLLDEAKGVAPKGDIAYARGLIASAPDFETARQHAAAAVTAMSGGKKYQHVTIDEGGKPVIGAFDPDTGDVLSTGAQASTAGSENEPLVAVLRNGRPVLVRRSEAEGATPAPGSSGDGEPLVAIVGPDGKPVLVPRSQAAGKTPASTRDSGGGRGVTSGDANRLADFDTSLDDVKVLRDTISGIKATGTRAAAGAALWNPITELTGWGADAKAKQAVIDRVKQVIGKALEGGVLRKEDEYKYTKILPTIADTPSVAKAKLDGLESALIQRRSTLIDALDDAGYNVESYKTRGPRQPPPPTETTKTAPKVGDVITVRGKKVKVTRVLADGRYEGEVLP